MKKLLTAMLTMASLAAAAQQQNTLLDQSFWRNNPDLAAVKAEVAKGNSATQSNAMAMDPIAMAINAGAPTETIKYLLDQPGADINKPTHDGRTYLHLAAARGNTELMEYLLGKGAKVNVQDSHGTTPLTSAAGSGQANTKVYDILLAHGDDLKKNVNGDGANALLLAIANDKDFALTNYFVSKGLDVKSADAKGNNAFAYAAKSGNIDQMKAVLAKGVPVSQQAILMAAQGGGGRRGGFGGPGMGGQGAGERGQGGAERGQGGGNREGGAGRGQGGFGGAQGAFGGGNTIGLPVYQYLESVGVKATAVSADGQNVLHYLARKQGQTEIIQYFLSKGVDVNQADEDGLTPLMNAASGNRDTATIALLLPKVKNINQATPQGQTALTLAVKSNSPQVISYLIGGGADVKVLDKKGNNLVYYAVEGYGAGERRFDAPRPEDLDVKLNLLKAKGLDITAPQQNGNTLYHLAVAKNDLALVQHLQPLNIDVNAKNKEGITALHKAAMIAKDDTMMKYLLSIGAKKELGTSFNETAYDLASANETLTKNQVSVNFLK
ncbi:ankyrin repeat protein [Mucilaginibacter yixingensis]|uniref:Ankyrin repeat protein n=1 Tax=Mucilaginibacter yixingensis TaxID=1295612 RepID=A0A2T5J621_9SPHI|nr:ankyrin repeat domain-containing protein [Mucilaginibacter yixingensis]PTQ94000.1 ankyrin repeat protein [Mucilaginibacter yixingensis]